MKRAEQEIDRMMRASGFAQIDGPTIAFRGEYDPRRARIVFRAIQAPLLRAERLNCSACCRDLVTNWDIHQHNIACATNGERSYAAARRPR
jgi:hypothetical protein